MKMNGLRKLFWCGAAVLSLASCKSQYDALMSSNDVDSKYKAAFDYFNEGKYQKAAGLFESMSVLTEGTSKDDTVQYYWGLSNYKFKDYITAEANFSKFVATYPRSPFAEDARFLRLDCLYRSTYRYELDQNPTRLAISTISEYVKDYGWSNPHAAECQAMLNDLNERLDHKAYESAKLYYNMEDYKAARVAFRNILKDDADNIYREDILFYIAKSSYKYAQMSVPSKQRERYMIFVDDYLNFIGEIPVSDYTKELRFLYAKAQKALGKYAGTEEELMAKERDFERDRKISLKEEKTSKKQKPQKQVPENREAGETVEEK